jgi:hypothetical protein
MNDLMGSITPLALCFSLVVSTASATPPASPVTSLDGEEWRLAPDPKNVGVAEKWWETPRPEAKPAKVPWTIQGVFPGYAGAAWYWRDVLIPANPNAGGRYLLRFWDVDYLADVWVNGTHVGRHEGAQARFTFDATTAVKPGQPIASRFAFCHCGMKKLTGLFAARHPTAERLLRNMLLYAARDDANPAAELPAEFEGMLKAMGYDQ